MKKCPFKEEKTAFYNTDVNDNTEIDYYMTHYLKSHMNYKFLCRVYNINCVGEENCPIDKILARFEKAVSKLENYIKVTASPMHNAFPSIFNMAGYCYKCGSPVFLRKDCKLCRPYKDKAMKIFNKFLGIERG